MTQPPVVAIDSSRGSRRNAFARYKSTVPCFGRTAPLAAGRANFADVAAVIMSSPHMVMPRRQSATRYS